MVARRAERARWVTRAPWLAAPLALVVGVALALGGCGPTVPDDAPERARTEPPSGASGTTAIDGTGHVGPTDAGRSAVVVLVVDGDTIEVDDGERVRLIGIDTPETKDPRRPVGCFGAEASARTAALLPPGTAVRLVADVEPTDRYGRTLAYVVRAEDDLFVNRALVAEGYALVATYPPNVAHVDDLVAAQADARSAGRGLWSACPDGDAPTTTTRPPTPTTVAGAIDPGDPARPCDPAYPTLCVPSAPDLDCAQLEQRQFPVLPPDPHRLDGDGNGIGCEG